MLKDGPTPASVMDEMSVTFLLTDYLQLWMSCVYHRVEKSTARR